MASIEPIELKEMVDSINSCWTMKDDGVKRVQPCEAKNQTLIRKSIVSTRDLYPGDQLTYDDLSLKRPASGIEPKYLDQIVGRVVTQAIVKDQPIKWDYL